MSAIPLYIPYEANQRNDRKQKDSFHSESTRFGCSCTENTDRTRTNIRLRVLPSRVSPDSGFLPVCRSSLFSILSGSQREAGSTRRS